MHEVHFLKILHAGCYLRGHVNQCAETAIRRTGRLYVVKFTRRNSSVYIDEAFVAVRFVMPQTADAQFDDCSSRTIFLMQIK